MPRVFQLKKMEYQIIKESTGKILVENNTVQPHYLPTNALVRQTSKGVDILNSNYGLISSFTPSEVTKVDNGTDLIDPNSPEELFNALKLVFTQNTTQQENINGNGNSYENMSIVTILEIGGITTLDARQSTANGTVTGDTSGKHEWFFRGLKNVPKLTGSRTSLNINPNGNVNISGEDAIKNVAGNSWNSSFYSTETFDPLTENFAISWLVESVTGTIREMGGLDDNATANSSYSSIEYAIYQVNNYFYSRVYEKGASIIIPNYTNLILQVGDRLGIKVINQVVTYFVLRGSTIYDIYTSLTPATTPLQFKGAFNRGNASSGASLIGDVDVHSETELDNFIIKIEGSSSDILSDEHKELLKNEAGIISLTESTYSKLQFTKDVSGKFQNDKEVTHEYRSLTNQTIINL